MKGGTQVETGEMKARSKKIEKSEEIPKLPAPPDIKKFANGMAQFPVMELREYAIKANIPDSDCLSYALQFELGEPGLFNYVLGEFDRDMEVLIEHVYYIDVEGGPDGKDQREAINASDMMKRAILRRFFMGEAPICGVVNVDEEGRLWIDVLPEYNIEAHLILFLQPKKMGVEFDSYNPETHMRESCCRIMFDGDSFFYEPVDLSVTHPLS